ncbi:MAG: hypothetical protein AAFY71_18185 [Bacteroidota bacterium]
MKLYSPLFNLLGAALCLITLSCTLIGSEPDKKDQLQNLSGTYVSEGLEDWGNSTYGHRTFTFDKGNWSLKFVLALDPEFNMPVFEFRTLGTYVVQEASTTVPEAFQTLFYEDKKFVTLLTDDPALIQGFGLASCGLQPKVEQDISASGCAIWPSVEECHEDHDLLSMDESGKLYFGVRPADNDMCTADKRPTALLPAVIKQ